MSKKMLSAAMSVLCALLLTITCTGYAENSNLISTGGFFAYQDGYVYFATDYSTGLSSYRNDGRETGSPYSSDFWRVAETAGAETELLVSRPAPVIDGGVILSGGFYMVSSGDSIYMIRDLPMADQRIHDFISRLDISSGTVENIAELSSFLLQDGDQIYFYFESRNAAERNNRGWKILDMQTGGLSSWTPEGTIDASGRRKALVPNTRGYYSIFNGNDFLWQYVLDIEDGYLYYSNKDKDTEIVSIWRKLAAGGEGEIIVPDASGFSEIEVFFVQGDMIFVADENSLSCWDIQTKMFIDTIPINHIVMDEPYYRFNVADGQVYYLRENGLYRKTPGMDNETLLVSGDMEHMTALALGDQYFYMVRKYGLVNSVWRIPFTASSLDEAEVLYQNQDERLSEQEENGWKFYEYENSVVISDYTGNETYAAVPAQIHGKPVISVGLTSYNPDRSLLALSVPEGVLHLGKLCSNSLVNISLPSSLIRLYDWGYPGVFQSAEGCVIQYAGTREEWQALDDASWSEYFENPNDYARKLVVICSDGVWTDPATVSEK